MFFVENLIAGIALGSIYALIALGFLLIYKATEVVNFGQGELVMLGAFIAYAFCTSFHFPIWLSFILTLLFMGLFGMFLERVFLRIVTGESVLSIIMVTLSLAIIIRALCGIIWGHEAKSFPIYGLRETPMLGELRIEPSSTIIISVTLILILILYLFFKFTKIGVAMRATSLNQFAAYVVGIRIKSIFSLTWAIAGVLAGLTGILVAPVLFLSTNISYLGIKAFPAAVLGGFTSLPGVIIGGVILGVAENLAGAYLPEGFKNVFSYIILLVVLMIRPQGIFIKYEQKKV